jgi:uridine kinase
VTTQKPTSDKSKEERKVAREIKEIKNGLPKVIEYWEMVKQEMDQHFAELTARTFTCDNTLNDQSSNR